MICTAHFPKDREEIISLWSSCFGDERRYVEFFLDNVPEENVLFVYKENDKIIGMMYLMPLAIKLPGNMVQEYLSAAEISENNSCESFYYVFALGVDKGHRGNGVANKLLCKAKDYAKKEDMELCLIPADDGLVGYYEKRGFKTFIKNDVKKQYLDLEDFHEITKHMTRIDISNEKLFDEFSELIKKKRDQYFKDKAIVMWNADNMKFALIEHIFTNGEVYVMHDKATGCFEYLIGTLEDDRFVIRESSLAMKFTSNITRSESVMMSTGEFCRILNGNINFCFE